MVWAETLFKRGLSMGDEMQWYDSNWLGKYFAAREIVARLAPTKMDEFTNTLAVLRTDPGFTVKFLPQFLDQETLAGIREVVRTIPRDKLELHEIKRFGRFIVHDWPEFTRLQHHLTDRISELAGEAVEPCYNFLSLYSKLGVCEPHLDAPGAKWTLDICVDQSEPWPIHFSQIVPWPEQRPDLQDDWREAIKASKALQFRSIELTPGDAVLFSGSSQWHYRDAWPRDGGKHFCDLLFLHYIPAGADKLVRAEHWARIFDIPELAEIPGIDEAY